MKSIRKRFSFANVMSAVSVFIALGGIAVAAGLPKNSVGKKQLKNNSVTTAKIKRNAVTSAKIKKNAITGAKVKEGSLTGSDINAGSLGTVPSATNSVTTDEVRSSSGTLSAGQTATIFDLAGVRLVVSCETYPATEITGRVYIESSTDGTTFLSWRDASRTLGPATPLEDREVTAAEWGSSNGPLKGEAGAPINVTTAAGASFSGQIGVGSEKDSKTCFYWFHGTIIS